MCNYGKFARKLCHQWRRQCVTWRLFSFFDLLFDLCVCMYVWLYVWFCGYAETMQFLIKSCEICCPSDLPKWDMTKWRSTVYNRVANLSQESSKFSKGCYKLMCNFESPSLDLKTASQQVSFTYQLQTLSTNQSHIYFISTFIRRWIKRDRMLENSSLPPQSSTGVCKVVQEHKCSWIFGCYRKLASLRSKILNFALSVVFGYGMVCFWVIGSACSYPYQKFLES